MSKASEIMRGELARQGVALDAWTAHKLHWNAKLHHTIQEHEYNGVDSSGRRTGEGSHNARRDELCEARIRKLVADVPGIKGVRFTGDPRGFTVKLILSNGRGNTWGGDEEGWGIG